MGNNTNQNDSQGAAGERVLALIRSRYPEYHPLMAIAELAHSQKVKDDPRLELECHKTLTKYVTPELKSVEVKAEIKETRRVIVSMFDGEAVDVRPNSITFDAPMVKAEQADPLWNLLEHHEELAA